jgi:hypothetical protein
VKNVEGPGSKLRRLEAAQLHASVQRLSPEEIRQIESALLDIFLESLEIRIPGSSGDVGAGQNRPPSRRDLAVDVQYWSSIRPPNPQLIQSAES